ncbi:MAG TPA: DUF4040 domain-containing protein [Candidatus Acidoferrales bacterium]|nr:DUF4040 domain-containing protein [Candidatus Acidoferrales bacterium]
MIFLQLGILVLVLLAGTTVVFTRGIASQAIVVSMFGLILALMFMAFQAPDVALSQLVVGAVGLPLMVLLAVAKLRRDAQMLGREGSSDKQDTK